VSLRDLFGTLLGNWTGTEDQAASPWAPATSARAMITFKLDVADTVVVQDYRQVRADGGEFTGHGVFMADPSTSEVQWWLFDSYAQPPVPAAGSWRDGELSLVKQTPRGTATHQFRVQDDQLHYRVELQLNGASEPSTFLTGTYRRISGH
jgi:hypothetical protein